MNKHRTFGTANRTSPGRHGHHGVFALSRAALGLSDERELVKTAQLGKMAVVVGWRKPSRVRRPATSRLKHAKNGARGRSARILLAQRMRRSGAAIVPAGNSAKTTMAMIRRRRRRRRQQRRRQQRRRRRQQLQEKIIRQQQRRR